MANLLFLNVAAGEAPCSMIWDPDSLPAHGLQCEAIDLVTSCPDCGVLVRNRGLPMIAAFSTFSFRCGCGFLRENILL